MTEPEPKRADLVPARVELVRAAGIDGLLGQIRPEWQARSLIERVKKLLPVDPSSACQRIFNAAIHDLRQKVVVAGIDIAQEAARQNKLPPVAKPDDLLENYSTSNIIDLAYRVGILSRPEWRRIRRCYDIRRDLEHEDDEYEAQVEDVVYVFRGSVESILSRDPVELLRVEDVKALIDAPKRVAPSKAMMDDFGVAPNPRQREIIELLVNTALNEKSPDITRQNAVEALRSYRSLARDQVKIDIANALQLRVGRDAPGVALMKVAHASGALPYLKQRSRLSFFEEIAKEFEKVSPQWREWAKHADLFESLEDVGGLSACPEAPRDAIVLWMVRCYIGEPGGYGFLGHNRAVFFSDAAAPRIEKVIAGAGAELVAAIDRAADLPRVRASCDNKFVSRP